MSASQPSTQDRRAACWVLLLGVCVGMTLSPGIGAAQPRGVEAAVGISGGGGVGKLADVRDGDMSGFIDEIHPVWVDLGYRISEHFFVGIYGQLGFGTTGPELAGPCGSMSGLDCGVYSHRLGIETQVHLVPNGTFDPWIGYGLGFEWFSTYIVDGSNENTFTASGFEFGNFQLGLDFRLVDHFFFGPVLSGSVGQYSSIERCITGSCTDESIADKALHGWIVLGIRVGYSAASMPSE